VLARAESFASRQSPASAVLDGFAMGTGFLLALLALGAVRELLGRGSLGADLDLLLGPAFAGAGWQLFPEASGLLIARLAPGAFVLLGLMLAAGNAIRARRRRVHGTSALVASGVEPGS